MDSYEQVYDEEWYPLQKYNVIGCCDCGLVHEIKIRVHKEKLQIQWNRLNRQTASRRRWCGLSDTLMKWIKIHVKN
jgi:hypothetical protein